MVVLVGAGNKCGKREFQCGSGDPQCVSALFVCDGVKDCRNGHDEENCGKQKPVLLIVLVNNPCVL